MRGAVVYRRLVLAFAVVFLAASCLSAAEIETAPKASDAISLDLKNIDVRSAIEAMFKNSGKNFALDPNVEGTIPSLSFRDVPFETALKSLTKSVGLVYRVDQNIYLISKRPEVSGTAAHVYVPSTPATPEIEATTSTSEVIIDKVPLNYSSGSEILAAMSGDSRGYGGFGNGYGGYGSNGGYGGGYGNNTMMGGIGSFGSSLGGYGGYSGSSYGGFNSGFGNYSGYGSSYGGYGGYSRGW